MQSLLIRPAKDTDLQGFLSLATAIGEVPGVWDKNPKSDFHSYLKDMKEDRLMLLLAIAEQEKSVGFSTVKFFKRLDPSGFDPKSCTAGVAVHPDYRRRGHRKQVDQVRVERSEKTRDRNCLYIHRNRKHCHAKTCTKTRFHQIRSIGKKRIEIP